MDSIFFLLGAFGIWTWVFLVVCFVLGINYAKARWFVDSDQLASLQAERRDLEAELLELRQQLDWQPAPTSNIGASGLIIDDEPETVPEPAGVAALEPPPAAPEKHRVRARPPIPAPHAVAAPVAAAAPEPPQQQPAPAPPEPVPQPAAAEPAPAPPQVEHAEDVTVRSDVIIERQDLENEQLDTSGYGLDAGEITDLAMGGADAIVVDQSAPDTVDHAAVLARHFPDEPVIVDGALGIVYEVEPSILDPLRLIKGVGPRVERSLNELGVYRFKQIANWSKREEQEYRKRLESFQVRIGRDKWVHQAQDLWPLFAADNATPHQAPEEVDHESKILSEFSGEDVTADPVYGIVYRERPELMDELHRIDGIGPLIVEGLHNLGVFRFKQIASWSRLNVIKIGEQVEREQERIANERWIPQARRLHWEVYSANPEWGSANPTLSDYSRKIERDYANQNVRADGDFGVIYKAPPERVDDLTQILGIDTEQRSKLNDLGVWRFRQVGDWSEANIRAFANRLGIVRQRIYLEAWIPQSWKLAQMARKKAAFLGESFRTDPKLGIVYYQEPTTSDDLAQINGLMPQVADIMKNDGIYTFKQIALWEPENVRAFADQSGVSKNEIFRNRWVSQADELHYKKYGTEL